MSDYERRFGGLQRLFGSPGWERLRAAHVMVVGVGGVGSWTVEALARSGVGGLTLVDLDDICVTNINRQLPALDSTIGRLKVEVLAERARAIYPEIHVESVGEFFTEETAARLIESFVSKGGSFVVDAIDAMDNKCRLIAACRERGLAVVTSGAAGGRVDPTRVQVADLGNSTHDRLLSEVRRRLRRDFGFPKEGPFGVTAVFSSELPRLLRPTGTICEAEDREGPSGQAGRLGCDTGFGSATFVTGAFGFAAAGCVVRALAS